MMEDEDKVESSKEQLSGGMNLVKQEGQQEAPPGWRSLALMRGEESSLQTAPQSHIHSYRLHLPP